MLRKRQSHSLIRGPDAKALSFLPECFLQHDEHDGVPKAALPRHSIRQAYFAPAGHLRPQPFARLAARAARRATAPFVELRALGLLGLSLREYPSLSAISVNFPISSAEHKRKREDLCRHLESSTDFVVAAGLLRKPVAQ